MVRPPTSKGLFVMMILSILATVVLLGALFYHRVSLFISSLILLA
ncbi:acyl-coenzyme A dehydrogenase domain protein [Shigella flexneri 4343-70]|nr:acyl-coenzyme A dehydrogenase domain protein [Shigella flexneri 4343-70]